ncbi:hypothetical protein OIO90_005608 [Microbotryomycetes sp. JL221]|nr:hypothetical protein OIO90_005608 [Microbotryomycetes sp. JL221]
MLLCATASLVLIWLQLASATPIDNATKGAQGNNGKTLVQAPPRGPDRYKALGRHTSTLESRELHDVFSDQGLDGSVFAPAQHDMIGIAYVEAEVIKRQTVSCTKTSQCAAIDMPPNAHHYCHPSKKTCVYLCDNGYTLSPWTKQCTKDGQKATTPSTGSCTTTAQCQGIAMPANAHHYCDPFKKACTYLCNSGYTLSPWSRECIKNGPKTTTTKRTTTTTKAATKTATSSQPQATSGELDRNPVSCTLTIDCTEAGTVVPVGANRWCDKTRGTCSWRCMSKFTQVGNNCVASDSIETETVTTLTTEWTTTTITSSRAAATTTKAPPPPPSGGSGSGCFPANARAIPSTPATASALSQWWCPESTEYAFLGFSYALYACQTQEQMTADFKRMKSEFSARYVRLYGNCDASWHNNAIIEAAASAGIGIYHLIWFGWDDPNAWKWRRDALIGTIKSNPKAPYVVRNVAVGSEPLFDWALDPWSLAQAVYDVRSKLSQFKIPITVSEMPYGYQIHNNAPDVFKAIDFVEGNVLPFFDGSATTGDRAWGMVSWSLDFFRSNSGGKRVVMTQTGWPSDDSVWKANTPTAVASVASEKAYFDLLDSQCWYFKQNNQAWFAQIWSDQQLGGWGILDWSGKAKFAFKPRTSC